MQALKRARLYNRGHVLKKQCQSSFTTFIISVLSYLIFIKSYVTLPKFMCLVKWWQKRWSRKTFQHSAQTGWWVYRVQAGTLQETQVKKKKISLWTMGAVSCSNRKRTFPKLLTQSWRSMLSKISLHWGPSPKKQQKNSPSPKVRKHGCPHTFQLYCIL